MKKIMYITVGSIITIIITCFISVHYGYRQGVVDASQYCISVRCHDTLLYTDYKYQSFEYAKNAVNDELFAVDRDDVIYKIFIPDIGLRGKAKDNFSNARELLKQCNSSSKASDARSHRSSQPEGTSALATPITSASKPSMPTTPATPAPTPSPKAP